MSGGRWRERAPILVGLLVLVGVLLGLQLSSPDPGLLYLAPAILLLGALAFDRYPGERLIAALARAWHPVLERDGRRPSRPLIPLRVFPSGGALLAMALAGRGPPG